MPVDDEPPWKSAGKGGGEGALGSALRLAGTDEGGVLARALPPVQLEDESDFLRPENTDGVRIFRDSGGVVALKEGGGGCGCGCGCA